MDISAAGDDNEWANMTDSSFPSGSLDFSPKELLGHLNTSVIGQESAKQQLSLLFSMHLARTGRRLNEIETYNRVLPRAILIGPTGVGKTHSMRTLSRCLGLPFVIADATSLVPSGIVGMQVEDIMLALWHAAKAMLYKRANSEASVSEITTHAHEGVVFLDEFDKLATGKSAETEGDSGRRLVQRRLLKFIEGDFIRVGVKAREEEQPPDQYVDTSKLLIIVGGAFSGIDSHSIYAQRTGDEIYRQLFGPGSVVSEDVTHFGFLPELSARLPLIVQYEDLTAQDLEKILRHDTESPLCLWHEYFESMDIELIVEDEAYGILASDAAKLRMGARGLHQLIFPYMADRVGSQQRNGSASIEIRAGDLRYRSPAYQ